MSIAHLPERGVLKVSGEDARRFLDGLVTCDMDAVTPERAAYGALLTPQGKIIVDFFVIGCRTRTAAASCSIARWRWATTWRASSRSTSCAPR